MGVDGVADPRADHPCRDQRERRAGPPPGQGQRRRSDDQGDQVHERIPDRDRGLEGGPRGVLKHEVHQQRGPNRGHAQSADRDVGPDHGRHGADAHPDQGHHTREHEGVPAQVARVRDGGEGCLLELAEYRTPIDVAPGPGEQSGADQGPGDPALAPEHSGGERQQRRRQGHEVVDPLLDEEVALGRTEAERSVGDVHEYTQHDGSEQGARRVASRANPSLRALCHRMPPTDARSAFGRKI